MAADREKVSSGIDAQLRAASTSAGECGVEDQVGRAGVTPPIWGRNLTTVPKLGQKRVRGTGPRYSTGTGPHIEEDHWSR